MAAAVEHHQPLAGGGGLPDPPPGQRVLAMAKFEATPPANISNQALADGDVIATTKEEEWVTKKKVELTTTRQIETRVKRQLVLEDGKVVEDSGPIVSTNTTEDTEKQEHQHTEHRTAGDEPPGEGWLAIPMEGEGLVKEVRERTVHSKEERTDLTEMEDVKHLGDLSDQAYLDTVQSNQDLRIVLKNGHSTALESTGPRLVHQSSSSKRIVDTADAQELSRVQEGRVVTETRRTTEHEEERHDDVPEEEGAGSEAEHELKHREGTQRYAHTKEQDLVEFLGTGGRKIGEQMRFQAENVEGDATGVPDPDWESLSTRMQRMRRHQPGPAAVGTPLQDPSSAEHAAAAARKDALTKRPLDFDQEEETRKVETSKWLENHFGSDSRSSKSSLDDEQPVPSGGHFINVTMKSRPINGVSKVSHTRVIRATPSPRPISPAITPVSKPPPAVFNGPARVFLSSPEPTNSEPASLVNAPPPPPPPVLPVTTKLVNGRQNSSSSGSASAGFFQGVSEWSERRGRQERVQVLPTGPGHTFLPVSPPLAPPPAPVNSMNHSRLNGAASPVNHSRLNGAASPGNHSRLNGTASPANLRVNGTISPQPLLSGRHHLNGSVSPGYIRPISPPQGYRSYEEEEVEEQHRSWRGRSPHQLNRRSPPQHQERRGSAELLRSDEQYHRRGSGDLLRSEYAERRNGGGEIIRSEEHYQRSDRHGSSDLLRGEHRRVQRRYSSPPPREIIEPPPDYSPGRRRRSRATSSPSPSPPPEMQRKSNLKTRFVDPPPPQQQSKSKSSFGDSLRRLVGKFRSSGDEKNKHQSKRKSSSGSSSPSRRSSIPSSGSRRQQQQHRRGSPPNEAAHHHHNDNGGGNGIGASEEEYSGAEEDEVEGRMTSPVPPPRTRHSPNRRNNSSHHSQLEARLSRDNMMEPRRFYLGEDPFGGSIYGREKEYDGVTPPRRSNRHRESGGGHRRSSQEDEVDHHRGVAWRSEQMQQRAHRATSSPPQQSSHIHHSGVTVSTNSSTLGRYHRSNNREDSGGRSTQTLPRKLSSSRHEESRVVNSSRLQHAPVTRSASQWERGAHTGSMINVSFVNNVNSTPVSAGPAKPARTYRSNLARSQSFNVTEAPPPRRLFAPLQTTSNLNKGSYYRSNPHLQEAASPLKSPGIISSISRSQKDLEEALKHEALQEEEETRFSPRLNGFSSPSKTTSPPPTSGGLHENKKKLFMKGLLDRAPELYRTLHGDEAGPVSPSAPHGTNTPFRDSLQPGVRPARSRRSVTSPSHNGDSSNKTMLSPSHSFRSNNDSKDYSETVRITSTSDDPLRPSVTNTVQSFSKKTTPRASGGLATETIESTETTTVTKSRVPSTFVSSYSSSGAKNKLYLDQSGSPMRNGGVVIEVRNSK